MRGTSLYGPIMLVRIAVAVFRVVLRVVLRFQFTSLWVGSMLVLCTMLSGEPDPIMVFVGLALIGLPVGVRA